MTVINKQKSLLWNEWGDLKRVQKPTMQFEIDRAVQWHYIDKLSNDTVPNHTLFTTNHQALFIYKQTKITEWFPVFPLKKCASARLAQCHEQPYGDLFPETVLNE